MGDVFCSPKLYLIRRSLASHAILAHQPAICWFAGTTWVHVGTITSWSKNLGMNQINVGLVCFKISSVWRPWLFEGFQQHWNLASDDDEAPNRSLYQELFHAWNNSLSICGLLWLSILKTGDIHQPTLGLANKNMEIDLYIYIGSIANKKKTCSVSVAKHGPFLVAVFNCPVQVRAGAFVESHWCIAKIYETYPNIKHYQTT